MIKPNRSVYLVEIHYGPLLFIVIDVSFEFGFFPYV